MNEFAQKVLERWTGPDRPEFENGSLVTSPEIDDRGDYAFTPNTCYCAQGDVLHLKGFDDEALYLMPQEDADEKVAEELGISLFESILLREVNDSEDGCPEDVLRDPGKFFGEHGDQVIAFWRWAESPEVRRQLDGLRRIRGFGESPELDARANLMGFFYKPNSFVPDIIGQHPWFSDWFILKLATYELQFQDKIEGPLLYLHLLGYDHPRAKLDE